MKDAGRLASTSLYLKQSTDPHFVEQARPGSSRFADRPKTRSTTLAGVRRIFIGVRFPIETMIDTSTLTTALKRAFRLATAKLAPTASSERRAPVVNLPFLGLGASSTDRLDAMMRASLEHGHVVRFELPWITAHLITHPDQIEEVLITRQREFDKRTRGYDKLREFLGEGLLTSDGDFWRRQRRIAQPAFHRKQIDGFVTTMASCTERMLDRWESEPARERDVAAEMMRLTLQIASITLLSSDTEKHSGRSEAVGRAVTTLVHEANQRISEIITPPDAWPTRRNRLLREARETLDRTVNDIIQERRRMHARGQESAGEKDLLQLFMEATDETGGRMNDKQLRDEVMTMFLAGHETTANALAWCFYLLGTSPQIARALHEEAVRVLGDREPTAEDVPRLEVARRVFAEALRLYPPIWIVGRSAIEDMQLGGYFIPKRSVVFIVPWITHRHPDFWTDPEGFDPDRFAPESRAQRHKHQYLPFIAGPRMCIGASFAQVEGQLVLAQVARRFRLPLIPAQRVLPEPVITLRPKTGVRVSIEKW
jgi:cytochrome P450